MGAGMVISSWLGLAGRVRPTCRGLWGAALAPTPQTELAIGTGGARTTEQTSQPPSNRSLQVWGVFFPHRKGILPKA